MLLQDTINQCTIFNKFLSDDLIPYQILDLDSGIYINYADGVSDWDLPSFLEKNPQEQTTNSVSITIKENIINNLISNNIGGLNFSKSNLRAIDYSNVWLPIFITKTDSNNSISTIPVFNNTAIVNSRIGIEDAITFEPKFQNWNLYGGQTPVMSIDWILNSSLAPLSAEYGLLCWIKIISNNVSSLYPNEFFDLNLFPDHSRLLCSANDQQYIKINNQTLFKIDGATTSPLVNGKFLFNQNQNIIEVSSLPADSQFALIRKQYKNAFTYNDLGAELWIPDGEFFAYYDNENQKNISLQKNIPISSKSYISPTLYSRYAHIYNILTLNEPKNLSRGRHLSKSRLLKKLCYVLATSPLSDGITHDFILSVSDSVDAYLNTRSNTISAEITALKNILNNICLKLKSLNISINSQSLHQNHILTKSDLFKKLLNKYGGMVKINNETTLEYKTPLNSSQVFINQSIFNFIDKNTTTKNIISNHQSIDIDGIRIKADTYGVSIKSDDKITTIPSTTHLKPILSSISFSIGADQTEQYTPSNTSLVLNEVKINIKGKQDINFGDPNLDAAIFYSWELTDGPCLRFGDYTRDKTRFARFESSNDGDPDIYVYGPGKYTIKCSVSTEYGKVNDTKVIYVVDSTGTYDGVNPPPSTIPDHPLQYIQVLPYKIIFPNLNQIALLVNEDNNKGLFWPINTDIYIAKYTSFLDNKFKKLSGSDKFEFETKNLLNSHRLKLIFSPDVSTIKIDRIILKYAKSPCFAFFKELIVQADPSYARTQRRPDGIDIPIYDASSQIWSAPVGRASFNYPQVSLDYADPIKTYGGYDQKTLDNLGQGLINNIPGLAHNTTLPAITGHKLDYKKTICYEYEPDGLIDPMTFKKGVFHPQSGFIINQNNNLSSDILNKSSVLKFNPGARQCFNFIGAGFNRLISSHDSNDNNVANIFKSSISVNIDTKVQPSPPPVLNDSDSDSTKTKALNNWKDGNQRKELPDHDVNHGYRSLDEGYNKLNDEYAYDASFLQKTDPNCQGSSVSYSFKTIGTKLTPTSSTTPEAGQLKIQNITIPGMSIADIEVRLNFLNYINTKNLIVWLEVGVCASEACKMANAIPPGSYRQSNGIPQCDSNTRSYLESLSNMNNGLKLYLLNQEYVQNNTYNFSVKFSNHASKLNKTSNINLSNNNYLPQSQTIISDNMTLLPTTMATGYSDIQRLNNYQKLIDYTDVNDTNRKTMGANNFSKYEGLELFGGCDLGGAPQPPNGTTTFTLNIAVLDEHDDMYLYDNINNNDLLTGFKTSINRQQSSMIANSLCNWELILHTDSQPTFEQKNDQLGLIEYKLDSSGGMKPPTYPGYTFIYNFKDKKYLLPPVNHNAPLTFINNTNICKFPIFELNTNPLYKTVEFPTVALLNILTNTAVGGLGGGLVGLGVAMAGLDSGYKDIFNFYTASREANTLNISNLSVDIPNYNTYSFGGPDKILLNVSKNNIIWYKLEASIFKYSNSLALEPNTYQYIKPNLNNSRSFLSSENKKLYALSSFKCSLLSKDDLIDTELLDSIKKTSYDTNQNLSGLPLNGDEQLIDNDIVELTAQDTIEENGYYIVHENAWEKTPSGILSHPILSQYYISRYINIFQNLSRKINNKKLIMIKGKRPFDLFDAGEDIVFFDPDSSNNGDNINIISKALIIKNNQYYSVFEMANSVNYTSLTFNNNTICVIKSSSATKNSDDSISPYDKWPFEKTQIDYSNVPEDHFSLLGAGSYGYGSAFVRPNILTETVSTNRLKTIYDIFNHKHNNFNIKNTILLSDGEADDPNQIAQNITAEFKGYEYSIEDIEQDADQNIYLSNNGTNISDTNKISDKILDINKTKKNIMYLKYQGLYNFNYGFLKLEHDFIEKNIIQYLSQTEIDRIVGRINYLESEGTQDIKDKIGDINQTDYIIHNGSISNIQDQNNSIHNHDPANCFDRNNTDNSSCYKKKLNQALKARYYERANLLRALEDNATKNISGSGYTAKSNIDGLIPHYTAMLQTDTNNSNMLYVEYENTGKDYYWINIDPKQVCSRSYDSGVKFLKSIKYNCYAGVGGLMDQNAPNICPYFEKIDDTKSVEVEINGIDNIKFLNPAQENFNADIIFQKQGNNFTYTIPVKKYQSELQKYSKNFDWMEYPVQRKFFINSGNTRDNYIEATETYLIPIEKNPQTKNDFSSISNRVYSIFNLDDINNLYVKIRNIPRKLKGIDNDYTKYIPDKNGNLFRSSVPSEGGPIFPNPRFWNCVKINQTNKQDDYKKTETTDYLKAQNEMIFRGFFGSVDAIEHKRDTMESLYPWEWIPFEYYSKPEKN
jgi:hypothetical protein